MIYLIDEHNVTEKLTYRIGQLSEALSSIHARGMEVTHTEVDIQNKSLLIRIRVREVA
ncbi:hypothetical protein [Butyrivibrio proteoclasticus]|uniref:hypothetical protein n=1 Tax=Butyrivibrio proteoclasticus TaxID=43305 RepID=UPI0002E15AC0|nr:hypothetical protein [Butyrivibrio proteoclasticus]